MRIGIDARNIVSKLSGISRYVIETSRYLSQAGHEIFLYLPQPPHDEATLGSATKADIASYPGGVARILWGNSYLPYKAKKDGVDVLWGPAHRLPIVPLNNLPQVVTIHDLVWHHAGSTMRLRGRLSEQVFMKPAIRRANRIVTVSHATKEAISSFYPWATHKIDVVYPGLTPFNTQDPMTDLRAFNIDKQYGLFVGTLEPRKNLLRLLEAFAILPQHVRAQTLLVIAGGQGWGLGDLKLEVERLHLNENVRLTGFVSDEQLGQLYRNARFLAMPSLYEGFGFPIIEANQLGVPVLTSNLSSMPEVGGAAALYVDPMDIQSIARGIENLSMDDKLHTRLSSFGLANAARFDWHKSAHELTKVFERAIKDRANKSASRKG